MAPFAVPKTLVNGDKSGLRKREENLRNSVVQDYFVGPEIMKNLASDPFLKRKLDQLNIKLIVQYELTHGSDSLAF